MSLQEFGIASILKRLGVMSVALAVSTVMLWGGTAVANAIAIDVVPPLYVGGVRFLLAAFFMIGWCLVARNPLLPARHEWKFSLILGTLLFVQISLFNVGIERSNSSHASILVNSYVFWVAAGEMFVQRTLKLRAYQLFGLLIAAFGCAVLFISPNEVSAESLDKPTLYGDAILAVSGFVLGIKILYTKHAVRNVHPGTLILWHDIIGTVLFFMGSLLWEKADPQQLTPIAAWALIFSGFVISGYCFVINAWLLKRHGASQISVFSFATPLFGVALGVILRNDELSIWLLLAGTLVALGIFLVNYTPAKPVAELPESVSQEP